MFWATILYKYHGSNGIHTYIYIFLKKMTAMAERKTFLRRINNLSSRTELIESAALSEELPVMHAKDNFGRCEGLASSRYSSLFFINLTLHSTWLVFVCLWIYFFFSGFVCGSVRPSVGCTHLAFDAQIIKFSCVSLLEKKNMLCYNVVDILNTWLCFCLPIGNFCC